MSEATEKPETCVGCNGPLDPFPNVKHSLVSGHDGKAREICKDCFDKICEQLRERLQ